MSNYIAPAFHPKTQRVSEATWLDNYFGRHAYGVRFAGDDTVYRASECVVEDAQNNKNPATP